MEKRIIIEINDLTISFEFQAKNRFFWKQRYYFWTDNMTRAPKNVHRIWERNVETNKEKEIIHLLKTIINKYAGKENIKKWGKQEPHF